MERRCAMNTERRYGWMWLRALELADEAERLQRRFLRYIGPGTDGVHWEPPVDIHETADGLILLFALPGVAPEDIEVRLERTALTVIALSGPALRIADSRYIDGCLEVRLVQAKERE